MLHTHVMLLRSSPSACLAADMARPIFHWQCHLPLALERTDVQAELDLGFCFELSGGPLAQGVAIRAVTLAPGGMLQIWLREHYSRLILETAGPNHRRCEAVAAETAYLQGLCRALLRLGLPQTNRSAETDNTLHVTGSLVSFPFLAPVRLGLIDRAEDASRPSEAAACTTNSSGPACHASALPLRVLGNSNQLCALTLLFYDAERFQLAHLEPHQIDWMVRASNADITAEARAEIDLNLLGLALIDQQGRVTSAARSRFGWPCTFRLPTPHILVKPYLIDVSFAEMASGDVSLDLRPRSVNAV